MNITRMLKPLINCPYCTEESITDYLLMKLEKNNIKVEKINRRQEKINGCDFIIEDKIAIQAKILRNGKYNIEYKSQKETFIKFCQKNNMTGYYLFYNRACKQVISCARIEDLSKHLNIKAMMNEISYTN
jgi:hypothetical protein